MKEIIENTFLKGDNILKGYEWIKSLNLDDLLKFSLLDPDDNRKENLDNKNDINDMKYLSTISDISKSIKNEIIEKQKEIFKKYQDIILLRDSMESYINSIKNKDDDDKEIYSSAINICLNKIIKIMESIEVNKEELSTLIKYYDRSNIYYNDIFAKLLISENKEDN